MRQATLFTTFRKAKNCCKCTKEFYDYSPDGHGRVCDDCKIPKKEWRIQAAKRVAPGMPLTPRENQITDLVTAAKLNKEIAAMLHLAEGTVKVFLSNIFTKTGATNRTELAVKRALKEI